MAQLHFAPEVPYAGLWDGSWSFSRTICAGNYQFGGKVTGSFIPVRITLRRNGKKVTVSGYQAITSVTIAGWSTSKNPPPVTVPPGDVWIGGCEYSRMYWVNPSEYDVIDVIPVNSEKPAVTSRFVDWLYRW